MNGVRHQLTRGESNKEIPGFPEASLDFNREIKTSWGEDPRLPVCSLNPEELMSFVIFAQKGASANAILVIRTLIWHENTAACLTISVF